MPSLRWLPSGFGIITLHPGLRRYCPCNNEKIRPKPGNLVMAALFEGTVPPL
jgi:hypothetical protein